jgi:glycosyltransferase involved in cell wall biosynthesis
MRTGGVRAARREAETPTRNRRTWTGWRDAPSVSVIIPTLNEARNLPYVLDQVPAWVDEIVVVDGLSVDDTIAVARRCRNDVRIVTTSDRGKGHALRAGFERATGDIVIAMDADGSTDPRELPLFVGALIAGADVALGTRFAVGGGTSDMELHRKLGNHALRQAVRVSFGARYSDLCYGYMGFWRDVLPLLDGPYKGFEGETMIHIRARQHRLRVTEVPSFESSRLSGASNLHAIRDGWAVLRTILSERMKPSPARQPSQMPRLRPVASPPWDPEVTIDLTSTEADSRQ